MYSGIIATSCRKAVDIIIMQDELCSDIDFVIPWVDGSDPEWQKQRALYKGNELKESNPARYRDWGLLPYWFRAVEKYAPWVRKIHFITCGQVPEWLNLNHPKLHFVKHEDYIPHKWLPTFSSHPIELNIHRIDGLAEKFVYFNDDVFLNAPVKPKDFFMGGLPCETAGLNAGPLGIDELGGMAYITLNDMQVIIKYFNFRKSFMANIRKWLAPRYGFKILLKTFLCLPFMRYTGFHEVHSANSYLKSTFITIWDKAREECESTSSHKFRTKMDVNQWLMKYWQIMSGQFYPRSGNFSASYGDKNYSKGDKGVKLVTDDIIKSKHKVICINDSANLTQENLEDISRKIRNAYSQVLPEKSAFEL